jgi:DNA-directed RNA polymerase subunit RPC12/RpoP
MQKVKEITRATVEGTLHSYTVVIYHSTYDEWDDPEGRIEERVSLFGGDRAVPTKEQFEAGDTGFYGHTDLISGNVHDGGGAMRRIAARNAAAAEEKKRERKARRAQVTRETPRIEMARCPECNEAAEPGEFEQRVYECGRCGKTLIGEDGRRCDESHIFTSKVGELACPSCEQPLDEEPERIFGVEIDGQFFEESELPEGARLVSA